MSALSAISAAAARSGNIVRFASEGKCMKLYRQSFLKSALLHSGMHVMCLVSLGFPSHVTFEATAFGYRNFTALYFARSLIGPGAQLFGSLHFVLPLHK